MNEYNSNKHEQAFALGLSFIRIGVKTKLWIGLAITYAIVTPIGTALGLLFHSFMFV